MRTRIQRWHVGQLIMVWLAGVVGAVMLLFLGIGALDAANSMNRDADYDREATVVRSWRPADDVAADVLAAWRLSMDTLRADAILASAGFVRADDRARVLRNLYKLKGAESPELLIPRYLERERQEQLERQTSDDLPAGTKEKLVRALGYASLFLILVTPVILFWLTWTWFDGRRPPAPGPAV